MNIYEATLIAVRTGKCIKRATAIWEKHKIQLKMRDVCYLCTEGKSPVPGWQPQAEDLTADDWVLVCWY